MYFIEYFPIFVFATIAFGLSLGFAFLSGVVGPHKPDKEKLSAYECGGTPVEDARVQCDGRGY